MVLDSGTGEEIEDPPTGALGFNSVGGLFDVIDTAIDECVAGLDVAYDPELGYPTSVFIDFTGDASGDDVLLRINGLYLAAIPTLPIALGACHFDSECMDQSCMPILSGVPGPDSHSAWTAFFEAASTFNIMKYVPAAADCNGGGATQRIRVGEMINFADGQNVPLLQAVSCAFVAGQTKFTIALIPCVPSVYLAEVVGFARIQIDSIVGSGTLGISLHGLWEG